MVVGVLWQFADMASWGMCGLWVCCVPHVPHIECMFDERVFDTNVCLILGWDGMAMGYDMDAKPYGDRG